MAVTQYIGARYVPLFAEPIDWDINREYEPLTIVYYQGNSYTSKQAVPTNIDITNTDYWALTGNYNAQIEQYRREVAAFDGRITANAQAIANEVTARMSADTEIREIIDTLATKEALNAETTARTSADTSLGNRITTETTERSSADTALGNRITQETTARTSADTSLGNRIASLETILGASELVCIGDSWGRLTANWPTLLGARLGASAVHNFCVGGNGWVLGSDNFKNQVDTAIADTTFDNDNVRWVVMYGGINDYRAGNILASDIAPAIEYCYSHAKAAFGNAKIVIVPMQAGYAYQSIYDNFIPYVSRIYTDMTDKDLGGNCFFTGIYWLTRYGTDIFSETSGEILHPNESGMRICSSYLASLCNGTYDGVHYNLANDQSSTAIADFRYNFDNGLLTFSMQSNQLTSTEPEVQLPVPRSSFTFGTSRPNIIIPCNVAGIFDAGSAGTAWVKDSSIKFYLPSDATDKIVSLNGVIHS